MGGVYYLLLMVLRAPLVKIRISMSTSEAGSNTPLFPLTCDPRALRPASLALFCSSFTASNRVSGTRRYFICDQAPLSETTQRKTGRGKEGQKGRNSKTHCASPDIALLELPEPIAVRVGLVHLAQGDVHEVVAVDEVAVECFAVFELDQLADGGERERGVVRLGWSGCAAAYHGFVLRGIE